MGMLMRRRIQEMKKSEEATDIQTDFDENITHVETEEVSHTGIEQTPDPEEEPKFTYEQLFAMTVKQIREIADSKGYVITKIIKDDVITEFLSQQK